MYGLEIGLFFSFTINRAMALDLCQNSFLPILHNEYRN